MLKKCITNNKCHKVNWHLNFTNIINISHLKIIYDALFETFSSDGSCSLGIKHCQLEKWSWKIFNQIQGDWTENKNLGISMVFTTLCITSASWRIHMELKLAYYYHHCYTAEEIL